MFTLRNLKLEVLSLATTIAVATVSLAGGGKSPGYGGSNNSMQSSTSSMKQSGGWQPNTTSMPKQNSGTWGGYGGNPGSMSQTQSTGNKQNGPWNNGQTQSNKQNGPWNQSSGQMGQSNYPKNNNNYPKNNNSGPWMQKPQSGKYTVYSKGYCDPNYCKMYGTKCSYGYCYKGYDHCHWYCRQYSDKCGCWFFYDQGCSSWYYWCQPDCCYYPTCYTPYQNYCCTAPATTYVTTATTYVTTPVQTTACYQTQPQYNACPAPYGGSSYGNAAPYGGQPDYGGQNVAQTSGPTGGSPMKLPPMPGEG